MTNQETALATVGAGAVATKECPDCHQVFPDTLEYFHSRSNGRTNSYCKPCARQRASMHHEAHHEDRLETFARYRDTHRDELRAYFRQRRLEHGDELREKDRQYYLAHPEKFRESSHRRYRLHKEEALQQMKDWAAAHPEYVREQARKKAQARKEVPLDAEAQTYARILRKDPCCYCGRPMAGAIDHIVAINVGGKSNWDNLTAACAECNGAKGDRSLLTYLLQRKEVA